VCSFECLYSNTLLLQLLLTCGSLVLVDTVHSSTLYTGDTGNTPLVTSACSGTLPLNAMPTIQS
jgi:hypothetical protein